MHEHALPRVATGSASKAARASLGVHDIDGDAEAAAAAPFCRIRVRRGTADVETADVDAGM